MKKTYEQITFCENEKRVDLLENFKLHLDTYLNNLKYQYDGSLSENVKAEEEHKEINKLIDEACSYIEAIPSIVGVVDENNYLTQGLIYEQDIIDKKGSYESFVNMTERAIAIYRKGSSRAKWRTYNPFFWIALFVDYLVGLPFETLGKVGLKQKKIEASLGGRFFKFLFYLIIYVEAFLKILKMTGYLPNLLIIIKKIMSK